MDTLRFNRFLSATLHNNLKIAIFPHEINRGTGILEEYEEAYQVFMDTNPHLTPYITTILPEFLDSIKTLEINAQKSFGYVYPRDWEDVQYLLSQNKTEFETYCVFVPQGDSNGQCSISLIAIADSINVLNAIRETTGYEALADIPGLDTLMGLSKERLHQFEEHLATLLTSINLFMAMAVCLFPRLWPYWTGRKHRLLTY